ncbi:WxL domain-containing protein [Enterococcus hirae]|nr:WxL domain-containing protein [Enterococcus hirae]
MVLLGSQVKVWADSTDNRIVLSKAPKYIIMDTTSGGTKFVDENGSTPEISGSWFNTSGIYETCELVRIKGTAEDKPIWYGDYTNGIFYNGVGKVNTFTNQTMVPAFTNTAQWGNIVKVLPTNKELVTYVGQKNTKYQWTYAEAIPLYIKAPKVSVKTDETSLKTMLSNQTMTGTGQAGDTVTIKDGSQTWTGQVQSDGNFSIETKGLKANDTVTITEVNGTGDMSVSDPVTLSLSLPSTNTETDVQLHISQITLPSVSSEGTGPDGSSTVPISEGTSFGILFKPTQFNFGTIKDFTKGSPLKETTAQTTSIGIGDTRQGQLGWRLTAQASVLTRQSKAGEALDLAGKLSMTSTIKSVTYNPANSPQYQLGASSSDSSAPIGPSQIDLVLGGAAQTVMNAPQGHGYGLWGSELSQISLSAEGSQTGQLLPGAYQGQVIWNLSSTPSE